MAATNDEIVVGQSLGRPPFRCRSPLFASIPLLLLLSTKEEPLSSLMSTLDGPGDLSCARNGCVARCRIVITTHA